MSEELPEGWVWTTLDRLALSVRNGIFVSRAGTEPSGTPILRISSVRSLSLDLEDVRYTGMPATADPIEGSLLRPGDLLFTRYNGNPEFVGCCAVVPVGIGDLTYPDKLIRVVIDESLALPSYVAFACAAGVTRNAIRNSAKTTAGQAGISGRELRAVPIPLPPLAEQHRIVEALEDHLSRLDAAMRLVAASQTRTRSLRGRFLESSLAALGEVEHVPLANVLREPLRNGHSARASADGSGIRTLTLTAVTAAAFSDANTKMTTADPAKIGGLWLEPGDILMQRSNTPDLVGTSAIYQGCPDWAIFPDLLIRIRFDCRVLPEYAALVLMSQAVRGYLKRSAKGLAGSMPKIDQPTINSIRFPLAAIDDQARVIKEITAQYDSVDRLEKALDTSRKRAESLKLSLLAAAVAGKLVPQDPVDGSAAELLARAKIERDDRPKTLRARKATATRKVAAPSKTTIVPTGIQGELAL